MSYLSKKDNGLTQISRVRTPRSTINPASFKIRHYERPIPYKKKTFDGKITFLPEMPIPEYVFKEQEEYKKKIASQNRRKRYPKREVKVENFTDLKQEILDMGSKLTEVESKLAQRRLMRRGEPLRQPTRSRSHYNIHQSATPMYTAGDYSQEEKSRMVYHASILPDNRISSGEMGSSKLTSSAEVGKVIKNIRAEIENWKKKKNMNNYQGIVHFEDVEAHVKVPTPNVPEETESEADKNTDAVSRNSSCTTGEKFSQHSHYPLDKYLPTDPFKDLPQLSDLSLGRNKTCKHQEYFSTLNTMTKELERLKKPVLRRSVSDMTTSSIRDSESCYTEELVETQFRKATYAFRKKNPNEIPRKKSHFTFLNHSDTLVQFNKENRRPFQRPDNNSPLMKSPEVPSPKYQKYLKSYPQYERPQQFTPRYEKRESQPYRSPLSTAPMTPVYDNYPTVPETANSQPYLLWSANSVPESQGSRYISESIKQTMSRPLNPEYTKPRIRSACQKPDRIPPRVNLGFRTEQVFASPNPLPNKDIVKNKVVDVCVNTDFINSSVYNFKSKFDVVDKEDKKANKGFAVQQLPKLSIRPRLVTQVNPNVNIWPHRVTKCKSNVGYVEFVHPTIATSEDKVQNFQPKTINSTRTNKKRDILTEEKPEAAPVQRKQDEPKLLRVAEEFCNTLNTKKHQDFFELKNSLHSLLSSVNELYDNHFYSMEELKKVSHGTKQNQDDLPRRMNMVADLLEDEIQKFGTQNMDHYHHLGRVMNVLVDDIQNTLNAVDTQKYSDKKGDKPQQHPPVKPSISPGDRRPAKNIECEIKGPDYETQKTLELRLSRIEKLFEINKSLKEIINQSTPGTTDSYNSSGPQDTTSYEMDATKSDISEKSFSDKPIEEKLNETFIVEQRDRNSERGEADEKYMKYVKKKADKILHEYMMNKGVKKCDKKNMIASTSKGSSLLMVNLNKEVEALTKELHKHTHDVEVEACFVPTTRPEETQTINEILTQEKETQAERVDKTSKQEETQTDSIPQPSTSAMVEIPEMPLAIRPFHTDMPPSTLSPAPNAEIQIMKQPEIIETHVVCGSQEPFLKFSNPNTNSFLEIRLPEQHSKFKSSLVLQSNSNGGDIKLQYDRNDGFKSDECTKEMKEIATSVISSENSLRLDENIQVTLTHESSVIEPYDRNDGFNEECTKDMKDIATSAVSYEDSLKLDECVQVTIANENEPTRKNLEHERPQIENFITDLSANLLRLLELRVNEMANQAEIVHKKKTIVLDDLSLSDLQNIQNSETNPPSVLDSDTSSEPRNPKSLLESDISSEPSPRLLPLPEIVLANKIYKDANVQVSISESIEKPGTLSVQKLHLKPYPRFSNEAEDVQKIRKKLREEILGENVFKVRSLESVINVPKTISPRPEETKKLINCEPETVTVRHWDSDEMSEGEIGYVTTSNTFSSGEIKPRKAKSSISSHLSNEDLLCCLKQFYSSAVKTSTPTEIDDSSNESETTPESTTSETPSD